jgi:threonine/homoserine/homoserine lactone efflux protein
MDDDLGLVALVTDPDSSLAAVQAVFGGYTLAAVWLADLALILLFAAALAAVVRSAAQLGNTH